MATATVGVYLQKVYLLTKLFSKKSSIERFIINRTDTNKKKMNSIFELLSAIPSFYKEYCKIHNKKKTRGNNPLVNQTIVCISFLFLSNIILIILNIALCSQGHLYLACIDVKKKTPRYTKVIIPIKKDVPCKALQITEF